VVPGFQYVVIELHLFLGLSDDNRNMYIVLDVLGKSSGFIVTKLFAPVVF